MEHDRVATLRHWLEQLLVAKNLGAVDALRDDGSVSGGLAPRALHGVGPFRSFHRRLQMALDVQRVEVSGGVVDGDWVAVRIDVQGATRAGRPFSLKGSAFARFKDGVIASAENVFNVGPLAHALELPAYLTLEELVTKEAVRRVPLAVTEHGTGDSAVVLLHGAPTTTSYFDPLVASLAEDHRVLVVDLPGYGASPRLRPYSLEGAIERVEQALLARGVERAAFVGFSGGAYRALDVALRGNVQVTRLALLGGFAALTDAERDAFRQFAVGARAGLDFRDLLPARSLSQASLELPERVRDVQSWLGAAPAEVIAEELEAFADAPDVLARASAIRCPVLLRTGVLDVATPVSKAVALKASMPRARFEAVSGTAHALLIEDERDTVASVQSFLGAPPSG